MAFRERLIRLVAVPGTARRRWAQARSRADAGALAAQYFEAPSGHSGPVRISNGPEPALRAALSDVSWAGVVVVEAGPATIRGYTDTNTLHSLRAALHGTGCRVETTPPADERGPGQRWAVANEFGSCAPTARRQMAASWQVTIHSPTAGALRQAAERIRADRAVREQETARLLREAATDNTNTDGA